MNREEAEILYEELLNKMAQQHYENNMVGVQATLKEIEKVRLRILNIDINRAIRKYEKEQETIVQSQK